MKRFKFILKYPKIISFLFVLILGCIIFYEAQLHPNISNLITSLGNFGVFISGFFYSYGFTAPISTSLLLILSENNNILLAGIIGGFGALISDIIIFNFFRKSLKKELEDIEEEKIILNLKKRYSKFFRNNGKFFIIFIASILISSPLPTEIGVILLSSIKKLSKKEFLILMYILHTLAILFILFIGTSI